jgi:hypothetical protein
MESPQASLAEIMSPDFQVKQARYENARGAVVQAYQIAGLVVSRNPGGHIADSISNIARELMVKMAADLNSTLAVLEERNGARNHDKTTPSKLLGDSGRGI